MSRPMLDSVIPGGLDMERLANVYIDTKRRKMARSISECSEDMTYIKVVQMIKGMEDDVVDRMIDEVPDVTEPMLRAQAQEAILKRLVEETENVKENN